MGRFAHYYEYPLCFNGNSCREKLRKLSDVVSALTRVQKSYYVCLLYYFLLCQTRKHYTLFPEAKWPSR